MKDIIEKINLKNINFAQSYERLRPKYRAFTIFSVGTLIFPKLHSIYISKKNTKFALLHLVHLGAM